MDILAPRLKPGLTWVDRAVLILYAAIVLVTAAHHKAWADEAQSWLLARDLTLTSLFGKYLHYEGTPGLFHLTLWMLCRLHVSYKAMHYVVAIVAIAGIWVFLRRSPFPLLVRATLPFTFYLLYQYAIVARSYIAMPLFVFLIASLFTRPGKNPVALAFALGLMANLCTQGFVLSAGFALLAWIRISEQRRAGERTDGEPPAWKRLAIAASILLAFWGIAVLTALPARDNSYLPPSQMLVGLSKWYTVIVTTTFGISDIWPLSIAILVVFFAYLLSSKQIANLLPYIFLQALLVGVVCRPWHFGLGLLALIGILWISWPDSAEQKGRFWARVLSCALLAVAAVQIVWSARAVQTDMAGSYAGDQNAAEFLSQRISGKRVAGFQFHSIGILPYFKSNIFENQHKEGFWFWSSAAHVDDRVDETVKTRPDFIDIGMAVQAGGAAPVTNCPEVFPGAVCPLIETHILSTAPYRETHRFCGNAFSGAASNEMECQIILEPTQK